MYLRSSDPTLTAANVVAKVVVIGFHNCVSDIELVNFFL